MVALSPDQTGALPYGYCLLWQPGLIWLHAVSDSLIGAAYVTIPLSLGQLIRQRRDIPFNWMAWCFVVFILACGATHLMSAYNIWVPTWWAAGWVKVVTAAASVPTAILLYRLVPQLVQLPIPDQLRRMNDKLAAEIAIRQRAEGALREEHAELERRVEARTRELAAANESLRLLESAVQHASDAFTVTTAELDPPGPKIVYTNPAFSRITGYQLGEVLGRSPRLLQGPATDRAALDRLRQSLDAGESFVGEILNYRKDGGQFWMNLRVTPIRDREGPVTHYVAVQRDVTEHRDLEAQLRHSQKLEAVGQLAGGVAHDFNNVLTAIRGNCALLLQDLPAADPRTELVHEIDEAGQRAARLTGQLLTFTRRQVRRPEALDFNSVVEGVLPMLRRVLGAQVRIEFEAGSGLGLVWGDRGQLEQVALNLAVNGRDAMPAGGTLRFETTNVELSPAYAGLHMSVIPGPYVMLAVSDTGTGMEPDTQRHIFEPFFTSKPAGKGTGLGLATVYSVVKQSKGNVWVYSEPGVGTTFKIYLPRMQGQAEPAGRAKADEAGVVSGQGHALVVEDDPGVREVTVRILRQAGYTVYEAADAMTAQVLVADRSQPLDVLLTDVVMPRMTGKALAEVVRRIRPGTRVVFMSGYTGGVLEEQDLLEPGAMLIAKPFTPWGLTHAVAEVLKSSRGP